MSKTIRDKPISYEYLAGFMDGEGCLSIVRRRYEKKPEWNTRFNVRVTIVNTNKKILIDIQNRFGGRLIERKRYKIIHNTSYALMFSDRKAIQLIELVYRFLRVKKPQADIILAFSTTYKRTKIGWHNFVPEKEMKKRQNLFDKIRSLNSRSRRD